MKIGHIISKLRYEKGYSQSEIAEILAVTKGAIGMWETDKRKPDYDALVKIADLFDVTTDYLLSHSVIKVNQRDIPQLDEITIRMTNIFELLNEDNKDILLGEAQMLLKTQRLEEKLELLDKDNKDILLKEVKELLQIQQLEEKRESVLPTAKAR